MERFEPISVVVPCYNSEATIAACLGSILDQDYPGEIEIIVVDNGSSDATVFRASMAGVKLLSCHTRGRSYARNFGSEAASHGLIAFVDSDVVLERNWISVMVPNFRNSLFVAGSSPVVPCSHKSTCLQRYRKEYFYARLGKGMVNRNIHFHSPPILNSAAMMVRKSAFNQIGKFDTRLSRNEDTDLSYRLFHSAGHFFFTNRTHADVYYASGIYSYLLRSFEEGVSEVIFFKKWHELPLYSMICNTFIGKLSLLSQFPANMKALHIVSLVMRSAGYAWSLCRSKYPEPTSFATRRISSHSLLCLKTDSGEVYEVSPSVRVLKLDDSELWTNKKLNFSVEFSSNDQITLIGIMKGVFSSIPEEKLHPYLENGFLIKSQK